MESYIDGIFDNSVQGWCWDPNVNKPLAVRLIINGRHMMSVAAASYRRDLEEAGKGGGNCAFGLPLPHGLGTGEYSVEVVRDDTSEHLTGSPFRYVHYCNYHESGSALPHELTDGVDGFSMGHSRSLWPLAGIAGCGVPIAVLGAACARLVRSGQLSELAYFVERLTATGEIISPLDRYREIIRIAQAENPANVNLNSSVLNLQPEESQGIALYRARVGLSLAESKSHGVG